MKPKIISLTAEQLAKHTPVNTGILDSFGRLIYRDTHGYRPARTMEYLPDEPTDYENTGIIIHEGNQKFKVKKSRYGFFYERPPSQPKKGESTGILISDGYKVAEVRKLGKRYFVQKSRHTPRTERVYINRCKTDFKPESEPIDWKRTGATAACFVGAAGAVAGAAPNQIFSLEFEHYVDPNDGGGTIASDTFLLIGSDDPNVSTSIDPFDEAQGLAPPGFDYAQVYRLDSNDPNIKLTTDFQPSDANIPDTNSSPIILNLYDDAFVGRSGTAHFKLKDPNDPNGLAKIPPDAMVYIRRYQNVGTLADPNYAFAQWYDLWDPNNHDIKWPVNLVQGRHAKMDLVILDECLAVSKLSPAEVINNFKHFSVFSGNWLKTGLLPGNLNGDNSVDFKDLELISYWWLCDCEE